MIASVLMEQRLLIDILSLDERSLKKSAGSCCTALFILTGHYCRQIADSEKAKGLNENARASKKVGSVARNAMNELEAKTGKSVITGENFLPPSIEEELPQIKD